MRGMQFLKRGEGKVEKDTHTMRMVSLTIPLKSAYTPFPIVTCRVICSDCLFVS